MKSSARAPRLPFALLVLGLMLGGLVLLLALNTASAANELQRGTLADQDQEVSADVAQLHNEVAASAAPGNLARAAQQLGMVPAGNPAFIIEYPNGRTVLRGHPKRAADDPLDIPAGTQHVAPKPTTRAAGSPTNSASNSASNSPTGTKHVAKKHAPSTRHTSSAPASPTSTPTPTITLPGGH